MNWRSAGIIIGVLAIVCISLILSVVYPFSTHDPYSAESQEKFSFEEADEYRVTGSHIQGQWGYNFEAVVTADNERYFVEEWPYENLSTRERYQSGPESDIYIRHIYEDEAEVDERPEYSGAYDDVEILQAGHEGNESVGIIRIENTDATPTPTNLVYPTVRALSFVPHEQTVQEENRSVYEPQDGWVEAGDNYRVEDTSGYVEVSDPETGVVKSADVTWEQTKLHRLTYLNYLLTTTATDESTTVEITYELETDDIDVETPSWVTEHRTNNS